MWRVSSDRIVVDEVEGILDDGSSSEVMVLHSFTVERIYE